MKTSPHAPDSPESAALRQQASDWIAKRDAGLSAREQDEFFEWLAADSRHAEVYAELQAVFRKMDIMVEWRPAHANEPNPDLLAGGRSGWRVGWKLGLCAGMAAAFALGFLVWAKRGEAGRSQPRLLAAGEATRAYEQHVLEDGSIVELNRGAQASVRFEANARRIHLVAGEAHFKVTTDPKRPFVVSVRGAEVTAVGTAFNIVMNPDAAEVIVTEGRVLVNPPAGQARGQAESQRAPAVQALAAGQGALLSFTSREAPLAVKDYSSREIEQKLAWKNEVLDFAGTPLSEVILEFNRRNHTQLVIGDDALRDLKITGKLRPTNLEGFLELLAVTEHVAADRFEPSKIVLRKSP